MKSSLIRSIATFAAGAATAALAADLGRYPDITVGEFVEQSTVYAADLARLGAYVVEVKDGRVGIVTNPDAACISPKPPVPVLPPVGEPIGHLRIGAEAVVNVNLGRAIGDKEPVYLVDLCRPVEGSRIK